MQYNFSDQYYKGIKLKLIRRNYPETQKAKRFIIEGTNQNVWIPNRHLEPDATIKQEENIDYIFRKARRKLEIAGHNKPVPGIKK